LVISLTYYRVCVIFMSKLYFTVSCMLFLGRRAVLISYVREVTNSIQRHSFRGDGWSDIFDLGYSSWDTLRGDCTPESCIRITDYPWSKFHKRLSDLFYYKSELHCILTSLFVITTCNTELISILLVHIEHVNTANTITDKFTGKGLLFTQNSLYLIPF
jgi:hypothetical protein